LARTPQMNAEGNLKSKKIFMFRVVRFIVVVNFPKYSDLFR
jgi:hypothetical protein